MEPEQREAGLNLALVALIEQPNPGLNGNGEDNLVVPAIVEIANAPNFENVLVDDNQDDEEDIKFEVVVPHQSFSDIGNLSADSASDDGDLSFKSYRNEGNGSDDSIATVCSARTHVSADASFDVAQFEDNADMNNETTIVVNDSGDESEIRFKGPQFPAPIQAAILPADFTKRENDRISGDMPFNKKNGKK